MMTISIRAVANCHGRHDSDKYQRLKENIKCEIEASCLNICFLNSCTMRALVRGSEAKQAGLAVAAISSCASSCLPV